MSDQSIHATGLRPSSNDIVIGIPAYNEEETVADVVTEALESARSVIVVDDGSDDRTAARAEAAGATVVRHGDNRGYGAALETIFETAYERGVEHLVVVDADGQHDPADAPMLVRTQQSSGADIVIGSRFVGGSQSGTPLYRRVGLAVINLIVGLSLRFGYSSSRVHDTQSGFRAYDAEAIEMLACRADLSDGMDASVDILFHAADEDCEFVEAPVDVTYDVVEANTHNPIVHGAVLVQSVLHRALTDRPVRLLGIPGTFCLFLGIALARASAAGFDLLQAVPTLLVPFLIVTGSGLTGAALAIGRGSPRSD
ncbi:glycosyltransferase family 2 protein [Halosimplex amylolyticum]|uniref:glycosyltransferase family 2 protein n=1 Tax=Halosimplex amylolyticum TaxID=3396616 RepID=UPI003F5503E6